MINYLIVNFELEKDGELLQFICNEDHVDDLRDLINRVGNDGVLDVDNPLEEALIELNIDAKMPVTVTYSIEENSETITDNQITKLRADKIKK